MLWIWPLAGCPSGVTSGISGGEGSTGLPPGITTFAATIDPPMPVDSGGSSMGGGGSLGGTTTGIEDSTSGAATETGSDPTDSGTSSGSPPDPTTGTPDPTTGDPPDPTTGAPPDPTTGDPPDPTTGPGPGTTGTTGGSSSGGSASTGPACNDVFGDYDNCLDANGMVDVAVCNAGIGNATCIVDDVASPTLGVCSVIDCVDECDCPAAPPTGNAPVVCSAVTGVPADLFCSLDCSAGQTCPDDMDCFGDLCVWVGPNAAGTPYGDCLNNPNDICGFGGVCLNDNVAMPTIGVCTNDCVGVGDCPAAPAGGGSPVVCTDVTGDGAGECVLDCNGGGACPPGMSCFGNLICVWN